MPRDNPRLLEILCVNGEFESHLGHQENMQVIVWFGGGLFSCLIMQKGLLVHIWTQRYVYGIKYTTT